MSVIPFHLFCKDVLHLNLTVGQSVLAKVVFGSETMDSLTEDEYALAYEMFGQCTDIPAISRRIICLLLGRGSGKTTLASAWSIYSAVTSDLSQCGPGDVPVSVVVAPDKATAALSVRMSREMMRGHQQLNSLILTDDSSGQRPNIQLRRPDGRRVAIEAFAASRGGASVRGRSIISFILDEAQFFAGDEASYVVNDKHVYRALIPRLLKGGKGIFVSTPWPTETLMSELFSKNFGDPKTALAVRATTLQMRGDDPEIKELVEQELLRDPDNAKREFFCELEVGSEGNFFDNGAVQSALDSATEYPAPRNPLWPCAIACDFAFKQDSSALCVVQFDGKYYRVSRFHELRPKPNAPLKPSAVVAEFAEIAKLYGVSGVIADGHYREALREHLHTHGLSIWDAPDGIMGKMETYTRVRAVLHEGLVKVPNNGRFISQAKLITARPSPGGTLSIRSPRRTGLGHGDLVSAWVLATHHLAYSRIQEARREIVPGSPEWHNEEKAKIIRWDSKLDSDYLEKIDRGLMNKELRIRQRLGLK